MLPKKEIIRKEKEIKKIFKEKESKYDCPLFHLIKKKNDLQNSRFLVITKKTIGKAVERNRVKRIIKKACLNIRHNIAKKYDIVIIPKQKGMEIKEIEENLKKALGND